MDFSAVLKRKPQNSLNKSPSNFEEGTTEPGKGGISIARIGVDKESGNWSWRREVSAALEAVISNNDSGILKRGY
jgi:hypothetical protein